MIAAPLWEQYSIVARSITIQERNTGGKTLLQLLLKITIFSLLCRFIYKFSSHFFIYHSWHTSNFAPTCNKPPFIKVAIFSDVVLISNYYGCKGVAIKLMPYYMINIIYKNVKPWRLKKLQIIQNINNLMSQVIVMFSDWMLIKQIIVPSPSFCDWGKKIFEKMLPGRMSNFLLSGVWWQNLGGEFWVGRDMSKNA